MTRLTLAAAEWTLLSALISGISMGCDSSGENSQGADGVSATPSTSVPVDPAGAVPPGSGVPPGAPAPGATPGVGEPGTPAVPPSPAGAGAAPGQIPPGQIPPGQIPPGQIPPVTPPGVGDPPVAPPGVGDPPPAGAGAAPAVDGAGAMSGVVEMGGAGAAGPGPDPMGAGGAAPIDDPPPDSGAITVQLADVRQLVRGFGINNNWAPLGGDAQELFGNGPGELGMNILRVGMGTDGNPYNGQSCYDDINAVTRLGAEYIMATLWSPPANCKSNGSVIDGGRLEESCYESWSTTIANFADKIEQNTDTTLYAMSPQNEVDFASCGRDEPCNGNYDTTVMSGAEAAAFQKIVGPKLRAKGVIPMSAEASEWIHVWSNESACCSVPSGRPSSDPLNCGFPPDNCPTGAPFDDGYEYGWALYDDQEAWDAFDIMGTHQYDSQIAYAWPEGVPKKEVWQTEMSGVKWWPEQGTEDASGVLSGCSTHIENGVAVARWIHSALTVGEASAWLYWWWQAIDTDDNEGLICKDGSYAKRVWTFGQFSKFMRPGHNVVGITGAIPDDVMLVASQSPSGGVVVVAINETTAAVELPITIAGGTAPASLTPHLTSASDDIAEQDPVTVTGGVFTASLPAMSVTTYVSE